MRSLFAAVTGVAVATVLAGCVFIPVPVPADGTTPHVTTGPGPVVSTDCAGEDLVLDESGSSTLLTGECASVSIRGTDITVTVGSIVGALSIEGDRATVSSGAVGAITIAGNDNTVDASGIDSITVSGDRNAVSGDTIDSVEIGGNDNVVAGSVTGSVVQNGDRNAIGD